jgi:hypothetical protein
MTGTESRLTPWRMVVMVGSWPGFLKPAPSLEPRRVIRFVHDLPEGQQFGRLIECSLAVSPDGKTMLYTAVAADNEDLMLVENFR